MGILDFCTEYSTAREIVIRSWRIGVIYRFVQLSIVSYIIGYIIIYQKGYQETELALGTTTAKVKGVAISDFANEELLRVWDPADYVISPADTRSFFVMTNYIVTKEQKQGRCADLPQSSTLCTLSNHKCEKGKLSRSRNGVMTGNCMPYFAEPEREVARNKETNYTCEIIAWCPVENDTLVSDSARLPEAENFTVFLKNYVSFPRFRIKKRNIPAEWEKANSEHLQNCLYNPVTNPSCPIFRLGDIVTLAGGNFKEMAHQGSVIRILISWNCDLDYGIDRCRPTYRFYLFDPQEASQVVVARGFNFRFAKTYRVNGKLYRDLYKAFGLLFVVEVSGVSGKFSFIELSLTIGSGIGLLAFATITCDFIVFHLHKKRKFFQKYREYQIEKDESNDELSACANNNHRPESVQRSDSLKLYSEL